MIMRFIAICMFVSFLIAAPAFGQGMMGATNQGMMGSGNAQAPEDDHTAREEAEGKEVWENVQEGKLKCEDLKTEDYEALGEYFMGRVLGASHAFMNQMMMQRMGEEGEEQMHEAMGRRVSGCDVSAAFPNEGADFMPMMMNMMGGGMMGNWSNPSAFKNFNSPMSMMNFGFAPFGGFGWFFMLLWWILIIVAIVALVRWLMHQGKKGERGRALEILKERYAKGEITKEEFEKMKRDIV